MPSSESPSESVSLYIVAATEFDGGAELYISRLGLGLAAEGINVTLVGSISCFQGRVIDPKLGKKWSLRKLPLGLLRIPLERRRLAKSLGRRKGTFSLHFKREQVLFTKMLSRRGRVVWTEHGTFPAGLFGTLISPAYRRASRYVDEVVCVSDVVLQSIAQHVHSTTKLSVIETAVPALPPISRLDARRRLGLSETEPVAVFAGRLTQEKRPILAIDASSRAGITILVAGDGPLRADVNQRMALDRVHVFGQIPDTSELFAAADFHLWTSSGVGEGFPTVLLEAARASLVTIAVRGSGFDQLIIESGGRLCDATAEDVSKALQISPTGAELGQVTDWSSAHSYEAWVENYRRALFCADVAAGDAS